MTRPLRILLATMCALGLWAGAATSAVAAPAPEIATSAAAAEEAFYCFDTCTFADARDDAPRGADLTSGRLVNGATAFKVSFGVRDLPRTGTFTVGAGLSGWGAIYRITKTAEGTRAVVWEVTEVEVLPKAPCPSVRVDWDRGRDLVRVTLPHDCTGSNAGGGSVINGIEFGSGRAKDRAGRIFYRP